MILLDTHAWLWWATQSKKLSIKAKKAIDKANEIGVSVISCWEVAMLVEKGRLGFSIDLQEWIHKALNLKNVSAVPITPDIAIKSTRLPGQFHGDPADRFIVATAQDIQATIITKDKAISAYPYCKTIW